MSLFLYPQTYSIANTGTYTNGVWVPGTASTLPFFGTIQPVTGKDLLALETGREDTGTVKIYSDREIPVSKENGTTAGGIVTYAGKKWEVIQELRNNNQLIPHYKYLAQYRGIA